MNESIMVALRLRLKACPLCEISGSAGLEYEVIKQVPCNGSISTLVQVPEKHVDKFLDALFPCETVLEATLFRKAHNGCLMKLVLKCNNCFFISLAEDIGILASDVSYANGGAVATFWLKGKEEFKKLFNYLEAKGVKFEVLQVTQKGRSTSELTPKQAEILKYAFEKGYFEKYREASLRDIADHFELGVSTTCIHLRIAMKKVVKSFFVV